MKWNTEQLELGLTQQRRSYRSFRHRSQRRLQRASWWFDQMRKAVENVDSWDPRDRATSDNLLPQEEPSGASRFADSTKRDVSVLL